MRLQIISDLAAFLAGENTPSAAEVDGMAYQVWEDGEVTSQKAGPLLWQRSLHCIIPASTVTLGHVTETVFTQFLAYPGMPYRHGYVWARDYDHAVYIRDAIICAATKLIQ